MSVDPLVEKYPAWSPYNYVMNNPVNLIDPTGMGVENNSNCGCPPDCPDDMIDLVISKLKSIFFVPNVFSSEEEIISSQESKQMLNDKVQDVKVNGVKRLKEGLEISVNGQFRASIGNQIGNDFAGIIGFELGHHSAVLFDLKIDLSYNIIDGFENNSDFYLLDDNNIRRLIHRSGYNLLGGVNIESIENHSDGILLNSNTSVTEQILFLQASQNTNNNIDLIGAGTGISIGAFFIIDANGSFVLRNRQ